MVVGLASCFGSDPALRLHAYLRAAYGLGAVTGGVLSDYTKIGGGGLTGTQMRCDAQFIGEEAYQRG